MLNWDIDIDVKSGTDKTKYGIRAMVYNEDQEAVNAHPSGLYLDSVPVDELTGNCAFDHKDGDEDDFLKVDILTNTAYDIFTSKEEVLEMRNREPNWKLLRDESFVKKLPHIGKHYDLIVELEIASISDLADALALIRPGKLHLLEQYYEDKNSVRRQLYVRPKNGKAYFKKSHAYSYAVMIVTVMNKLDLFSVRRG